MKRVQMFLLALPLVVMGAMSEMAAATENGPMDRLQPLVGRWEGEGWERRGSDSKKLFSSVETIEQRMGGELLIVEGIHHEKETGEMAHHAVAVITWNEDAGKYRFDSHLSDGRHGNYDAEVQGEIFVWWLDTPDGGTVRYSITVDGDLWNEVGEYSRDQATWHQFFGMTLNRVGDPAGVSLSVEE